MRGVITEIQKFQEARLIAATFFSFLNHRLAKKHVIPMNWWLFDWNFVFGKKEEHLLRESVPRGMHGTILSTSGPLPNNVNTSKRPPETPAKSGENYETLFLTPKYRAQQFLNDLIWRFAKFCPHNTDWTWADMCRDHMWLKAQSNETEFQ